MTDRTERTNSNASARGIAAVRHFSRSLRSGSPNCWRCETPLYAAGGQIFILRMLIWGTRCVKGEAHCAISVVSHSCAKDAQEWGTPGAGCAGG